VSFVYFTDRDLGKRFPEILRTAGLSVERHADHFGETTPDETWLAEVGRRGWIALTHDQRIRYKPNERDAVMRHNVALLVIVGKAAFPKLARAFVNTLSLSRTFSADINPHSLPRSIGPRRLILHAMRRPPAASSFGLLSPDNSRSLAALCG
jgi:hypothetical protein